MERAWEGIINVHKWHLKNAVLNYCKAVVVWRRKLWSAHLPFFGNTFHLWLSHVIVARAAAARCLFSLPLPLLPPVLLLAPSLGNAAMPSREMAASAAFTASCASAWALQGLRMSLVTVKLSVKGSKQLAKMLECFRRCISAHLAFVWTKPVPWYISRWCNPWFCLY